jgi:hypothetical protein
MANENISKVEKKYQSTIQQNNENWFKKEKEYESNEKKLQN